MDECRLNKLLGELLAELLVELFGELCAELLTGNAFMHLSSGLSEC